MKLKFAIGDKVKVKADGEVGEVVGVSISPDGIRYTISSKEVDLPKREVIHGVKHCLEDELEAVKEKHE